MSSLDSRNQLALLPELDDHPSLPSITTLPEFDRAMDNLIKMSDLGAFISINVHGVKKTFSIHTRELEIPDDFLKEEFIDAIENPKIQDKLLFGKKETSKAIENFMVKKIFINPKMFKILKENADPSTLNFDIIIVKSIETGDYGQVLNKNYGGIVGIKYYS